ncbi:hypothetical protein ACLHWY_23505 [Priestia aryabhattai]|uniref:hypothetical protein n=1 Tax=Priestia aryabhattai TaxID=412384 RepID=UPI003983C46E
MLNNILEAFKTLEPKDQFTVGGIILTSVISLITLINTIRINWKSAYLNSVTKERIESMTELKEQVAKYLSLIRRYQLFELSTEDKATFLQELEYRRYKIDFQLNEKRNSEAKLSISLEHINKLIGVIEKVSGDISVERLKENLNKENFPLTYVEFEQENSALLNNVEQKTILKDALENRIKNLNMLLKSHLKTEWEKIKKESKKL